MEEKVDIVALGELLIDFTEAGHSQDGRKLFEQNPGGAPANLLTVASHFGYHTSFIGKVGNDMHGKFLKKTLQKEGINTDAIVEDPGYFTTLAFVEIGENGEREFSFARKPGADTQLKKEELDQTLISGCRIFHFGSLSLTDEPAESATIEAVKMAKAAGVLISYDPNYRPSLWKSKEYAVKKMKSVVELVDVMKVSDEESILLTGAKSYEQAAEEILAMGPKLVAITLGEHGVLMATKNRKEIRATISVQTQAVIDKWGNKPLPNNYIFPYMKGNETAIEAKAITRDVVKRINKRMKLIGEELGIGNITTYTARHSYATVLKRSGVNISYISESLGYTDLRTTEAYLASFEKEERTKNTNLLTSFL